MKKMLALLVLPLFASADDGEFTFLWGTTTNALVFEATNLTVSVKTAIRDDFAYVLSCNIASNAEFEVGVDTYNQEYTGRLILDDEALPEKFPKMYFKTHGGTNYFLITHEDSTNYLAQIMLTNQHHSAISGLSNFVYTLNHSTTATLSRAAFAAMCWKMDKDRAWTLDEMSEDTYLRTLKPDEGYFQQYPFYVPSILDLAYDDFEGKTWMMGVLRARNKKSGSVGEQYCTFRKGKWRFVTYLAD